MLTLRKGRYRARFAETAADVRAAQRLRHLSFVENRGLAADRTTAAGAIDADAFDAICRHMLVEDEASGTLVCCFRLLPLSNGTEIGRSYSAQHYNLAALAAFDGPMVELGRFCIHPDWRDPDILRVAWGAMTRFVDETGAEMLFGCSSFQGTEATAYHDAFAMLLVLARLQSFDRGLEEAALDLGASHSQVMRRILLPHLYPAIGAGAAIGFFQSIENFNVTLFTRGTYDTLTVYVFSKVRTGITPTINALALIMIAATLLGAIGYEIIRRRRERRLLGK